MIIKNLWKKIKLYCGCHEELVELVPNTKGSTLFYSCPHYYSEGRKQGEKACDNRVRLEDFQSAVEYIGDRIAKNEQNGIEENLVGLTWTKKNITFKIFRHDENEISISAISKLAHQ